MLQLRLPLRIQVRVPVLTLAGARGALGVSEDDVRDMIDHGDIAWAWNIATRGAKRAELRILAASIKAAQSDLLSEQGAGEELSEEDVIRLVYGPCGSGALDHKQWIWGKDFYRVWNFDRGHLFNLILDGSLELLPRTKWRRGPGGSPCVTWNSAVEFLRKRRL